MKDFQERVVNEREELNEKINKLTNFLSKDDNHEQSLLWVQLKIMRSYSEILKARIKDFE